MKKIIIGLICLTIRSWAFEAPEQKIQSLLAEFESQAPDESVIPAEGICLAPTVLPLRTELKEAGGRFTWALLPEYYFEYKESNSGSIRSLTVDYRPITEVFNLFPALYGIWMAEPYTSLKAYCDLQMAAAKSMNGYTELMNTAEIYYNGTSGWKYVYKFSSGNSYYVWYSHLVWQDNVAYNVFFLCLERDYLNSLKQTYFTTVLALVHFGVTQGVAATDPVPAVSRLAQNYPNPFNAATCIEFSREQPGKVELGIFNPLGQQVRTLCNESGPAGKGALYWDGRDDQGRLVPSGIYFYRLHQSGGQQTRSMLLVK